ncbi:MAG: GAF domain-containing protein [Caldilineales bacterium]|nr:GAF domain-containing protein [Caldilineales bacterium]
MHKRPHRLIPHVSNGTSLRNDLGLQVLALYLLFIGPVLLGALIFDNLTRANLQEDAQAADLALARAIALETNATLGNAVHTVQSLAGQQAVMNTDVDGMAPLFRDVALARNDVNLVYRLGPDGIMIYHYPEGPSSTVGVNFSFREYFQAALQSDGPIFSNGRISPTTGQPVATAVMPLYDASGAFTGIVATNLALENLSDTLKAVAEDIEDRGLIISVVDAGGQVVAHPGLPDATIPAEAMLSVRHSEDLGLPEYLLPDWDAWNDGVVERVLSGASGTTISTAPDESEWVRSYVPVPAAGWGVIVQRPTDIAFATIRRYHRLLLAAIAIYLAGGIVFWWALSRRVMAPLERLAEYSQRVGRRTAADELAEVGLEPLSKRQDQVGHLARSLTAMASAIDQRFRELSTLLETSRSVVSSLDSSQVIDNIVAEVQRLLDVDRAAVVVHDRRLDVFRIRASRGLSPGYVEQLRIEPSEPHSAAMEALRSQAVVEITDVDMNPIYSDEMRTRAHVEGFRSLLAVPLITQHAAPAALVLYRNEPHQYSTADLELVASFANHAAMAMEHAALFAQSDASLQEQTRRLEAIVESLNDGLILASLTDDVLFCNQRAADMLGMRRAIARQRHATELTHALLSSSQDPAQALQSFQAAIGGGGAMSIDITRPGREGRPQDVRLHIFEVTDAGGELIGWGQYWQDITHDKDLDRMKSALLSTVSHELRTPLASIKGFASTLLAKDVEWDATAQREFIQTISDESDRLTTLVNNLLDLSRLEGGALRIQRELYSMGDLLEQAAARDGRRLDGRLRIQVQSNLPELWIDPPRMETVVRNLLENAAKYSPPDSDIELTAERQDGHIVVQVRDYGTGVPLDQQERIFDRFYRGEVERERRIGGAGLGLAICKGFVEAHGGRIWVQDAHPGALFAFSIPTIPPPEVAWRSIEMRSQT